MIKFFIVTFKEIQLFTEKYFIIEQWLTVFADKVKLSMTISVDQVLDCEKSVKELTMKWYCIKSLKSLNIDGM